MAAFSYGEDKVEAAVKVCGGGDIQELYPRGEGLRDRTPQRLCG